MSPRATSLLYAPADVFSLLLLLLLSLLRGRYFPLPLPVVVFDTRCSCAAAALRCCCWGPPIFPAIPPPGTTPPILPVLRHFLFFRQTRDCSDILTFWSPPYEICVFINIMVIPAEEGRGGWGGEVTALPRPVFLVPLSPPALHLPAIVCS